MDDECCELLGVDMVERLSHPPPRVPDERTDRTMNAAERPAAPLIVMTAT